MNKSPENDPLVSVIMNCYNGEIYLCEAVESVMAQTYQNWELIFWDNQSNDRSSEIIKSYNDSRIHYHYAKEFTTLGEARNLAISNSRGEFIAFLDADDLWLKNKLEEQLPLFDDQKVGIVISDTIFFNENNKEKQLYLNKKPPTGEVFRELLRRSFISLETAIIRRIAIEKLDHCFEPSFDVVEEYDFFIRLLYEWELAYVDEVLAKWRVHGDSWTWTRGNLFPLERKLLIEKLNKLIPDFKLNYHEEIALMERQRIWEEAEIAWKAKNCLEARKLLRSLRKFGLKWEFLYWMALFPHKYFLALMRVRGAIQPL